jgi:hypothetical protein
MVPAAAHGTVTIGSTLSSTPGVVLSSGPWTVFQDPLGSQFQAPGGLVSPANGAITEWRLRVGSSATPTAFRVIRPLAGGLYTGAGTSSTVTPTLNAVNTFATQLPIKIGDRIGINCCTAPGAQYFSQNPTGIRKEITPPLVDGGPGQSTVQTGNREILLNADIEPTSAFAVDRVKYGKGGKVTVTATLPNPGVLAGGDKRDATLATAAAGKKKTKYLKRSSLPVGVAGQTIRLLLKPTNAAHAVLAEKGRLRTKAKLVFTPTGGSPSTQIIKVKLKR